MTRPWIDAGHCGSYSHDDSIERALETSNKFLNLSNPTNRAAIAGRLFRAGVALFLVFACFRAAAAPPERLSQNAQNEIGALLQEKSSWTPTQAKMESQLIHASKRQRGESFAPGAPHLELDVKFQPDGRVLVDLNARVTPELLALIAKGGGRVVNQFSRFHAIRALVTAAQLETLAGSADVVSIRRADEALNNTGSVDSQGDATHLAAAARGAFGATGAGVKVGVLSDSVDFLSNSQSTGDLGTVTVLSGQSGVPASGEGTAMLEIVHDLAPNAQLFFATANSGQASFAQNILDLRANGCDIIVDDEGYFNESPFQDAVIAQAVNTVTAGGALYFSSAGNSGNLDSGTAGAWEGDFVDGGAAAAPIPEAGRLHSFGTLSYNTVAPGGNNLHADLFWSDPLGAAADDYDLFVLDSTGTTVLRSSTSTQNGSQDPYESVSTLNVGERIVIVKFSGTGRFLHLDTGRGQLSIATSGATLGHSAATNAFCVAAVDVATAYPGAFTGGPANPVEQFSSDGPRHVFFNADGTPITPGNFSSTGGAIRQKPDLTAADGVSTSLSGFTPFYGTSAAAPHAASIAALLKSYNPNLTPSQVRAILTTTTLDNMLSGVDRDAGFGVVMAMAALQAAPADALFITPGMGFTATGHAGGPFSGGTGSFILTNNGAGSFNWTLANASAWLNVSPASGALTSGGTATTVTASLNASANNLAPGLYIATIAFTNQSSHVGQSRQFVLTVTPLPAPSSYADAVTALNPAAYWRLNETNRPPPAGIASNSGTLGTVATGFPFNGAAQGLPGIVGTSFGFSNPGYAVTFFGSHVDVPYLAALNPNGPFTVEFWVNPAGFTPDLFCPASSVDLTQNSGNSRSGWLFYQNSDNTWQFRVGGFAGYAATASGGTAQTNVWQHLVGVYDGAGASLYVNGQKVSGPISAGGGFAPNGSLPLRFGATTIPNRTYAGRVDEAAFYTSALSAATIAAHYNAATTNNAGYSAQILASAPAGYWHLDDLAPSPGVLPVATNIGSLAPNGNGIYQPGSLPGVAGVPNAGFGASNGACQFNGTSYIRVPGTFLNPMGPLTLLAWAKVNPANGNVQSILNKGTSAYHLTMDGTGHPHFGDGAQSGGDLAGPNRIDDGQWHQLAGIYDGVSSEILYVDGQPVATTAGANAPVVGNSGEVWIGGDPDAGAFQFFNGVIDEAALFTNALSAGQVQQLYFLATNAPPPRFTSVTPNKVSTNLTITLNWTAGAGRMYQVQYKTNLAQSAWSNLVSVTATSSTASTTDVTATNRQRFYRVILLP